MKRTLIAALSLVASSALPALAQDDVSAMSCADYAAADNTKQQAIAAQLQSAAAEMEISQTLMANDIFTQLNTMCADTPDMMIVDAAKQMK